MLSCVLVAFASVLLTVWLIPREWSGQFGNDSSQGPPVRLLSKRKDASLSFITGDFTENGLTDDVSSLYPLQVLALYDWLAFYQRNYQFVGFVTGWFYGENGQPTEALLQVEASLAEGKRVRSQSEAERLRLPACNSEWSAASGGRVWCSTKSGGVKRDWAGVPRKLFSPGSTGVRCVCVENPSASEEDPNLQKYEGCPPHADSCSIG
ncbi:neuferricin isoform X2 [Anabas testudineus]|uniref:neuferricin isoform X2 n=1 Tax=Anabas testudineus TaxID=64144 RepID=UPI000E4575AF|nr:neuferricin isoform X2 [Anabas testudineus]